jgi:hypothetical protein
VPIYFIQNERSLAVKIGISGDVRGRLATLQGANSDKLVVLASFHGTERIEWALHARFMQARIRGEWFELTDELRAVISHVREHPDHVYCVSRREFVESDEIPPAFDQWLDQCTIDERAYADLWEAYNQYRIVSRRLEEPEMSQEQFLDQIRYLAIGIRPGTAIIPKSRGSGKRRERVLIGLGLNEIETEKLL